MKKALTSIFFLSFIGTPFLWSQTASDIAAQLGYPQTIVYNAKIVTVDDASFTSSVGTIAQAMAIRDGKILAVGDNGLIRALAGPQTELIDLKGRTIVPGMIPVHNHPQDWAPTVPEIMLHVVPEDVIVQRFLRGPAREQIERLPQVLEEAVQAATPGEWIRIVLIWDDIAPGDPDANWAGTRITKQQLDQVAPNNPLLVRSRPVIGGGHISVMVNQKAVEVLRKEGMPDDMAMIDNLVREEKTGISSLSIYRMANPEVLFKDHFEMWREIIRLDLSWWASIGQTTFGQFLYHHPNVIRAYRELDRRGELENRVAWGWGQSSDIEWERLFQDPFLIADLATRDGTGTDYMWNIGTGQNGGGCTSLRPLSSRPQDTRLVMGSGPDCQLRGTYNPGSPTYNAFYKLLKAGGRLMAGHETGDISIDNFMNLIEQASKEAGLTAEEIRAKRHVADHMSGWPRPNQIPRLKDLGMVVGGTDRFIRLNSAAWMRDYGESGLETVVPRGALLEAGIMNGIELDKPYEVSDATVFDDLSWAVSRKGQDGKVYAQHQGISREVALKSGTIWGAYYVLKEDLLGSLEKGKFADFLVLDRDYLTIPEDQIDDIRILMTMVGGKVVHLVPSLARELRMQPKGAQVELGGPASKY